MDYFPRFPGGFHRSLTYYTICDPQVVFVGLQPDPTTGASAKSHRKASELNQLACHTSPMFVGSIAVSSGKVALVGVKPFVWWMNQFIHHKHS